MMTEEDDSVDNNNNNNNNSNNSGSNIANTGSSVDESPEMSFNEQATHQPTSTQKSAVMHMFKKGLTAGKHKFLQSVGKADKIQHLDDYREHNDLHKDTVQHYKAVEKVGKRLIKSCEQVSNNEQAGNVYLFMM